VSGIDRDIGRLPDIVADLSPDDRDIVERIFDISVVSGKLDPPDDMKPWLQERFGSVEAAIEQRIVRVTNKITFEEAFFNPLRSLRPRESDRASEREEPEKDILRHPISSTPADTFGRIEGKYCMAITD